MYFSLFLRGGPCGYLDCLVTVRNCVKRWSYITFRFLKNIPKSEKISYKPLIIVQLLAILFNYGDCGDASGSFNFFERILLMNGWNIIGEPCQSPYLDQVFFEGFARAISNICFLVFFIFLVVFLVKQTQRK